MSVSSRPRVVFMGTPGFAATILEILLDSALVEVVGVYSQPDRPAGRGKALKMPEVKVLAQSRNIPVFQPLNFRTEDPVSELASLKPDFLVVAAYGLILPQRVLDIPRVMPVNVHASILPRYRGAAPIQRAIMNGDKYTGNTIMRMEAGLDSGPVMLQSLVDISPDDTSATLHDKLASNGGYLLVRAFEMFSASGLDSRPQDESKATFAPKLAKHEGQLDFNKKPEVLHNLVRGLTPWPGANFTLQRPGIDPLALGVMPGVPYSPEKASEELSIALPKEAFSGKAGTILGLHQGQLLVECEEGCYGLRQLKPAGGKLLDAQSFYNGYIKGREGPIFFG